MDFKDHAIVTQVAFKAATEFENELDMDSPEGQSRFERVFAYLSQSLHSAIDSGGPAQMQAAEVIRANFPGTTVVGNPNPNPGYVPQSAPQPMAGGITIKGTQHGPLPDWLYEEAAKKGVNELYDNRDRAIGTKRPWFKATVGGDNAAAFWPPR